MECAGDCSGFPGLCAVASNSRGASAVRGPLRVQSVAVGMGPALAESEGIVRSERALLRAGAARNDARTCAW